jgi:hypothetical protein
MYFGRRTARISCEPRDQVEAAFGEVRPACSKPGDGPSGDELKG